MIIIAHNLFDTTNPILSIEFIITFETYLQVLDFVWTNVEFTSLIINFSLLLLSRKKRKIKKEYRVMANNKSV